MQLSDHFTLDELTWSSTGARLGIDNSPSPAIIAALQLLCRNALDPIRAQFGPVHVDSGYRCAKLNRAVGGADDSRHLTGQAADIVVAGTARAAVAEWARDHLPDFDQIILENVTPGVPASGWVHVAWCASGNRRSVLTKVVGESGYRQGLVG